MHAGAVACSVREVCICKFHCHACRSSGLFSPWSMYLQISLVMHARAVVILLVLIEFVLLQWPIQFVIYIYIFSSWSIFIYHLASAHGSLSSCCYDDIFSSWSIFIYFPCLFVYFPRHVRRRSGYSTDSYGLLSSCCFDDGFSSWSIFIFFFLSCTPAQWLFNWFVWPIQFVLFRWRIQFVIYIHIFPLSCTPAQWLFKWCL